MYSISEKNRKNVQAIRGGACLFICLNHCTYFNQYSFGEIGVEFFIIISGMLTALNASKHDHLRSNYLISKLSKIMPLYWIATLAAFFIGCVMPQLFSSLEFNILGLINSLLLIPGHTFYLFPGWTLTYFFVFYFVYYIADKISNKRDSVASIIIVFFVLFGFALGCYLPENIISKYSNPILLEFVYGIALYHLGLKTNYRNNKNGSLIVAFNLLILFFNYNKYLGQRWLLPSLLTSVSIYFLFNSDIDNIAKHLLEQIGDISFTIYILHPFIIRPIEKIIIKIFGLGTPVYFLGVVFELALVIALCSAIQPILKRLKLI